MRAAKFAMAAMPTRAMERSPAPEAGPGIRRVIAACRAGGNGAHRAALFGLRISGDHSHAGGAGRAGAGRVGSQDRPYFGQPPTGRFGRGAVWSWPATTAHVAPECGNANTQFGGGLLGRQQWVFGAIGSRFLHGHIPGRPLRAGGGWVSELLPDCAPRRCAAETSLCHVTGPHRGPRGLIRVIASSGMYMRPSDSLSTSCDPHSCMALFCRE